MLSIVFGLPTPSYLPPLAFLLLFSSTVGLLSFLRPPLVFLSVLPVVFDLPPSPLSTNPALESSANHLMATYKKSDMSWCSNVYKYAELAVQPKRFKALLRLSVSAFKMWLDGLFLCQTTPSQILTCGGVIGGGRGGGGYWDKKREDEGAIAQSMRKEKERR